MSFDPTRPVGDCPDISSEITKNSCWDDIRVTIHHDAVCDLDEVRRALPILLYPGELHELRALPSGRGQVISVDELDAACLAVQAVCNQTVYYSLNPIHIGAERASAKTVSTRVWFLIDIDPAHSRDTSATDVEKNAAWEVMNSVLGNLADLHWPMPILIDSGNGYHLLYRIDLPNDALAQGIIKNCLEHLAFKWNTAGATIDKAVHDAPRIAKLPGTWSRKGIPTPERPHRICRLIEAPKKPETVPIEKLQELSQLSTSKKNENTNPTWDDVVTKNGKGFANYIQSAIEREGYRILSATEGTRHTALFRASAAIGNFASWPEMHAEEAKARLIRDGERVGLPPSESLKTVTDGWTTGEKTPRPRPLDPQRNGKHVEQKLKRLCRGLSEIKPENVDWIWENRIAIGFISIFAGRTSMGKSLCLCDLAARLTRGDIPAFSVLKRTARTLFISEDHQETMLAPRLLAAKCIQDPQGNDQVWMMTFEAMAQYTLYNTEMLEQAYNECGSPTLIVIDPPSNFLGKTDEHKNAEVRQVLMILIDWIIRRKVALVFLHHMNKQVGKGLDAIERIIGSTAWSSVARITLAFDRDPDEPSRYLCGGTKNNLGPKADTLAFNVVPDGGTCKVEWIGLVDTSMDDALNRVKKKSRGLCAVEWLTERFLEKTEWESEEIKKMAADAGLSKNALWSPEVNALPIKKKRRVSASGDACWFWIADPGWPPVKPTNQTSTNQTSIANGKPF